MTTILSDAGMRLRALLAPYSQDTRLLRLRTALRPLHGHITVAERLASDGGFARYRLILEPWLAFLQHRRNNYVKQDKTVLDIVQDIFRDYQDKGRLVPSWRLALADPAQYRPREVCTQFEESDLAFVQRLLADEGLMTWIEHEADPGTPDFGRHTLVIADHNAAFTPNPEPAIRNHHTTADEQADSITEWHAHRRLSTNAVQIGSWHEQQVR